MIDLQECRNQIDAIDRQIVELFEQRMIVSQDVAEYKRSTGKAILDREREMSKLDNLSKLASNEFNGYCVKELFSQIMSMSRKLQYTMLTENAGQEFTKITQLPKNAETKVVFYGVNGSYTEQAMEECFGPYVTSYPAESFRDVMAAVAQGKADYGVLPIENSTTGGINDSYDLLIEFDNYIVAEHVVNIHQALVALPGTKMEEIKSVYSHPQGLLQTRQFLEEHPSMKAYNGGSTAASALKVLKDQDRTEAAIASVRAAKAYGLEVLAENINDEDKNSTRFIIISKKRQYVEHANQMSISFSLPHESGTLYNMLSHIIFNNLNMTRIESRPLAGRPFEYRFIIDFEGCIESAAVRNALRGIEAEALELKILGNYECV